MRRGACNRTLWSTGDNLRNSPAHAGKLGDEGPLDVHGLQGNDVSLVRPQNEPPLAKLFRRLRRPVRRRREGRPRRRRRNLAALPQLIWLRSADARLLAGSASGRLIGSPRPVTLRPTSGWRRRPSPAGRSAAASTAAASASRSPTPAPASTTTISRSGTRSRPARRRSSRARSSTPARAGRPDHTCTTLAPVHLAAVGAGDHSGARGRSQQSCQAARLQGQEPGADPVCRVTQRAEYRSERRR